MAAMKRHHERDKECGFCQQCDSLRCLMSLFSCYYNATKNHRHIKKDRRGPPEGVVSFAIIVIFP